MKTCPEGPGAAPKASRAEAWLSSAYPSLAGRWREACRRGEEEPATPPPSSPPLCTICGERPSTGPHYGVQICEADKQFLKRTFHKQVVYPPCSLRHPPRPRGWCGWCRLESSLSLPLQLSKLRFPSSLPQPSTPSPSSPLPPPFPRTSPLPPVEVKAEPDPHPHSPSYYLHLPSLPSLPPLLPSSPSPSPHQGFYWGLAPQCKLETFPPYPEEDDQPLDLSTTSSYHNPTTMHLPSLPSFPTPSPSPDTSLCLSSTSPDSSFIFPKLEPFPPTSFSNPRPFYPSTHLSSLPSSLSQELASTTSSLHRLSVSSTVLGEALTAVAANLSTSSLANLSNLTDLLSTGGSLPPL